MGDGQGHSLVTLSIGEEMGREQQRWVVDKVTHWLPYLLVKRWVENSRDGWWTRSLTGYPIYW